MSQQENVEFEKGLSPLGVWGLALGAMIGWGCFVMPGDTLLPKAGPIGASIGLILGALMIVVISFSYSYLISKFPVAGGEFVYADTAFGKTHAFLCGWFIAIAYWSLIPMNATAVGLVARYIFPGPLQTFELYDIAGWTVYGGELIVDILAILIIGLVNMRGVEAAGWFQTAVALGLVGCILIIGAVILAGGVDWSNLQPYFAPDKTALASIFTVAALAPWAYVGFDCIPQASEEYAFSNKKTKALLISSISVAALMYMIMNIATAIVGPWEQFIIDFKDWPTGAAVEHLIGTFGLILLAIAMLCGIISGLNAFYLAGSRLLYSMAIAEAIPAAFGKLDPKHHVPRNAIIFMMLLAMIAPFFGRQVLSWLVDMTAVGADMGFTYTTASAFVMAKRAGDKKQMYISGLGVCFAVFFICLLVLPFAPGFLSVQAWAFLIVWLAIGAIFFAVKHKTYYASTALQEKVAVICAENADDEDALEALDCEHLSNK
ncbi:MAG: APC family permease [Peptococcaceae bacterium]|nr:APC family permease [Peptococcaceae bacterium]